MKTQKIQKTDIDDEDSNLAFELNYIYDENELEFSEPETKFYWESDEDEVEFTIGRNQFPQEFQKYFSQISKEHITFRAKREAKSDGEEDIHYEMVDWSTNGSYLYRDKNMNLMNFERSQVIVSG